MSELSTNYAAKLERIAEAIKMGAPIDFLDRHEIRQAATLMRRQAEIIDNHRQLFRAMEFTVPHGHSDEGGCPSCGKFYYHDHDCPLKAALDGP